MKKKWALIVLGAIVIGNTLPSSIAAQKPGRSTASSRKTRTSKLAVIDQFKTTFQNDAGKVRLVALVSPT